MAGLAVNNATLAPHSLCKECQSLCQTSTILQSSRSNPPTLRTESFKHHSSLISLCKSAEGGCHLCSLARHQITESLSNKFYDVDPLAIPLAIQPSPAVLSHVIHTPFQDNDRPEVFASLKFVPEESDNFNGPQGPDIPFSDISVFCRGSDENNVQRTSPRDLFGHSYTLDHARLSVSTGSDACVSLACQWLDDCLQSHTICSGLSATGSTWPTRLIEIDKTQDLLVARIRLVADLPSKPEYLALSHCWGDHKFRNLTLGTLSSFQNKVDLDKLPLTFQHALGLTYRLGLRHIWIDSLCIVQDDQNDWWHESQRMGQSSTPPLVPLKSLRHG